MDGVDLPFGIKAICSGFRKFFRNMWLQVEAIVVATSKGFMPLISIIKSLTKYFPC